MMRTVGSARDRTALRPLSPPVIRVAIEGTSMLPTLAPGEWWWARVTTRVRPGDLVVVRHPGDPSRWIVKRAIRRERHGWWVEGDNPHSSDDSRSFGVVDQSQIIGRLWWRYRPWSLREGRAVLRNGRG